MIIETTENHQRHLSQHLAYSVSVFLVMPGFCVYGRNDSVSYEKAKQRSKYFTFAWKKHDSDRHLHGKMKYNQMVIADESMS